MSILADLLAALVLRPVEVLVALGPLDASVAAAHLERRPDLAAEVRQLARVESRGVAVGVHREHARRVPGRRFWASAVRAGWLAPEVCPAHVLGDGDRWGPRGPHGHVGALAVRHLGACVAPEVLDEPLVSAVVAVRRLVVLERVYGLKTPAERAEAWRRGVRGPPRAARRWNSRTSASRSSFVRNGIGSSGWGAFMDENATSPDALGHHRERGPGPHAPLGQQDSYWFRPDRPPTPSFASNRRHLRALADTDSRRRVAPQA